MSLAEGLAIKLNGSQDQLAQRWVDANATPPDAFVGTLATLNTYIAQAGSQCGNELHQKVFFYNKPNLTSACQKKLQQRYADKLQALQGQEKTTQDNLAKAAFAGGNTIYIIIAAVVLLLILLYFLV